MKTTTDSDGRQLKNRHHLSAQHGYSHSTFSLAVHVRLLSAHWLALPGILALTSALAAGQTFLPLTMPSTTSSTPTLLSQDGSVVAGQSITTNAQEHPFRWTASSGIQDLGTLGGNIAYLQFVSVDGAVLVGQSTTSSGQGHAFRWTSAGMLDLGVPGGSYSRPLLVSSNGAVIVGESDAPGAHTFVWSSDTGLIGLGNFTASFMSPDGSVLLGNNSHATLWTSTKGFTDLGTLGGTYSYSSLLSPDGSVVLGSSQTSNNQDHAFQWTSAAGMVDLGTLGGNRSFPSLLSADRQVAVGWSFTATGEMHAFRWTSTAGITDLGTLGGGFSQPTFVSPDGSLIVGQSSTASGENHAFLWASTTGMVDLGTLGGYSSYPMSVSGDWSVIVGQSTTATGENHVFRWTAPSGMTDIGTLAGSINYVFPVSIDGAVIVGQATTAGGNLHAFRWTSASGIVDLTPSGSVRSDVFAVTSDGSVVIGTATTFAGDLHAFRWTTQGSSDLGSLGTPVAAGSADTISKNGAFIGAAASKGDGRLHALSFGVGSITELGALPDPWLGAPQFVSDDGTQAVGSGWSFDEQGNYHQHLFRCTNTGAAQDLGSLMSSSQQFGDFVYASDALADCSVVVGSSYSDNGQRAFRWSAATGMTDLGTLPGHYASWATTVNPDGSSVLGCSSGSDGTHAFRWTAASGMTDLGNLGSVLGVLLSADGSTAAATIIHGNGVYSVGRWTSSGGMLDLGTLGGSYASVQALSTDGTVVVGSSSRTDGTVHAFRWTAATGMADLGTLGEDTSSAQYASLDCSVIFGRSYTNSTGLGQLFRWTAAEGMKPLQSYLCVPTGWNLTSLAGLSTDGLVACGNGLNPQGSYQSWVINFGPTPAFTPAGQNVTIQPLDPITGTSPVSLLFSNVLQPGMTTVSSSSTGSPPPDGFKLGQPPLYYDISTTAQFSGPVQVCFSYTPGDFVNQNNVRLFHYQNGAWLDVTTSVDMVNHIVCGSVTSFSPFAIFEQQNQPPVITALTGPMAPLAVGSAATVDVSFTDVNTADTETVTFDWGDASTDTVATGVSSGSTTRTHTYAAPGVYSVLVQIADGWGGITNATYNYVVVYDPNAGFVTGGGWIVSPAGAYAADPTLTGKATFGFVSKYQKGATVPTGRTQFQFAMANFNFQSLAYEWLVISGPKAQYKGTGTVNGSGTYGFLLSATDGQVSGGGGVDEFRIKVWDSTTGTVMYDNVPGAPDGLSNANPEALAGGSIVIHQ